MPWQVSRIIVIPSIAKAEIVRNMDKLGVEHARHALVLRRSTKFSCDISPPFAFGPPPTMSSEPSSLVALAALEPPSLPAPGTPPTREQLPRQPPIPAKQMLDHLQTWMSRARAHRLSTHRTSVRD